MEQHRSNKIFPLVLALCLLILVGRIVDLCLFTEAATGFVTAGPVWLRYALPAMVACGAYLAGHFAAARPAALLGRCAPLGGLMLAGGVLLAGAGLAGAPAILALGSRWFVVLDCLAPFVGGIWLLVYGPRAFAPLGDKDTVPAPALTGLPLPLCFAWLVVRRFAVAPAAVVRLGCTLRVLSAVAALLFASALLKLFFVPGQPVGHTVFATGMNCFLFATCCELPQAVFEALHGTATVSSLLLALGLGVWGLCGLVCARGAAGADSPLPTPKAG